MLHHPKSFVPPGKYHDHCQLAPSDLLKWLQEQVAVPARVQYEHPWGLNYWRGLGLLLD